MSGSLTALTFVAALGAGLNGGVFFAFSTFVTSGLARLRPADGIAAMQSINVTAVRPPLMLALFGTGALSAVLGVWALAELGERHGGWLLAGSLIYLAGLPVMTMLFHVPRNDALARLEPGDAGAAEAWLRYVADWTAGNHVRTVAGLAATAAFILALLA
jgi:uncharacterized membrane protein